MELAIEFSTFSSSQNRRNLSNGGKGADYGETKDLLPACVGTKLEILALPDNQPPTMQCGMLSLWGCTSLSSITKLSV